MNKWRVYYITISHINLIHIIIHNPQERKLVVFSSLSPLVESPRNKKPFHLN